jgi:hypothetical protein
MRSTSPTRVETTGTPQAIASSTTFGHPSRARQDEEVGGAEPRGQLLRRARASEAHRIFEAVLGYQRVQFARIGIIGRRSPDDAQHQLGILRSKDRQDLEQAVKALARDEMADRCDDR